MEKYQDLSEEELNAVIAAAKNVLAEKQAEKRSAVLAEIRRLAASIGVEVTVGGETKKAERKPVRVAPKYRNPENSEQTWTGRGVAPKWMQAYLQAGREKSEFLI